jgi:hypothetical protein
MTRDAELLCEIKNAGVLDIREDDHRRATQGSFAPCLGKGAKVGPLA